MIIPRFFIAWLMCFCLLGAQQLTVAHVYTHSADLTWEQNISAEREGEGKAQEQPCLQCLALCPIDTVAPVTIALAPLIDFCPPLVPASARNTLTTQTVESRSRGPPHLLV
jgi:hypothetical protein